MIFDNRKCFDISIQTICDFNCFKGIKLLITKLVLSIEVSCIKSYHICFRLGISFELESIGENGKHC